jgi:DNA-binding NtrC family response regulator
MGEPARHHILVVDDEVMVRRYAGRVLEEAGFSVTMACDGAAALDLIAEQPAGFAVVVSDVVMPRMNGVELLERLSVSSPRLPVILMSGYATGQLEKRGIAAPCAMLGKPFAAEALLAEVRRCLKDRSPDKPEPSAA